MAAPWFETADLRPTRKSHIPKLPSPSTSPADNSTPVVRSPPQDLDENPPIQLRRSSRNDQETGQT
jgi:hypothetical protein